MCKKALDEVLEIIGRQVFYSYINLNVTCKEECVPIYGYENEFKQAILNILSNAKDAISLKEKNFKARIDIEIFEKNNKKYKRVDAFILYWKKNRFREIGKREIFFWKNISTLLFLPNLPDD